MENNCIFLGECEDNNLVGAFSLLKFKNVKLLAIGAPICIRHLYFQALDHNYLDRFNFIELSKIDFTFGSHITRVEETARRMATGKNDVILIYLSCMDLVSGTDYDSLIKKLKEENLNLILLKRGPMAKRGQDIRTRLFEIEDEIIKLGGAEYE